MYDDTFRSILEWQAGTRPEHVVHPLKVVCDLPGVKK
jgi:hypothetical protein